MFKNESDCARAHNQTFILFQIDLNFECNCIPDTIDYINSLKWKEVGVSRVPIQNITSQFVMLSYMDAFVPIGVIKQRMRGGMNVKLSFWSWKEDILQLDGL